MKTKNQRWWDLPAAIFLFLALFSAAVRLTTTEWTENLGTTEFLVVAGSILGFALARSIFSGRTTFLLGLVYSLFVIPWQMGLLIEGYPDWNNRLYVLYARLYWATADFLQNKPVHDPILFLATMMILYWFASLLSSYRLVRHANPWLPLLSLGGMILVIEYTFELYKYTKISGGLYSAFYLFFCLMLLGRVYYLRSKREWEQRGGTVEMEVGYDLGRGVAVVSIVVAILAWQTPNVVNFFSNDPSHERVSREFQAFRDRISKAVNSLRSPNAVVVEGYGNSLSLGTGGNQSTAQVFTVSSSGSSRPAGRMYWTARIYDTYYGADQGWESTITDSRKVGPTERSIVYPGWQMRQDVSFTFRTSVPLLKTLYFAGDPLNTSRSADAIVSIAKDGATDLNAIMIDPPIKSGETYNIHSSLAQPTVTGMRDSGTDYPDWIKQRYLQMPANFSPRVIELAKQIAGDEKTPYDKAQAITQYLRRTITYSETVPEPPRNREPIEWFLFDLRAGFCNYYASSEVMMLRSLGIPARLAVGYAEGEYDPEQGLFTVIGKDSHAWPEVYFPKLGWIIFEPTVSQPLNNYPLGEQTVASNPGSAGILEPEPTIDPFNQEARNRAEQLDQEAKRRSTIDGQNIISPWLIVGLVVLVIAGVLVYMEQRRRKMEDLPLPSWLERTLDERGFRTPDWLRMWSRRSLRTPMENLFANVALILRVWGTKVDPAQTPAEQIAVLVNVVPGVKDDAFALLEEYQRAMYSPYPANTLRAKEAVSSIRSAGIRNWFMRLVGLES